MLASVNKGIRDSNLHSQSSTRIHLLPRKCRIQCESQSLHLMSSITILHHLSSQWIVTDSFFQGTLPLCIWFHMAIIMTKKKSILDLPFSATQTLGQSSHPLPCSHTPSKFRWHPHPEQSIPWKGFLTSEDTKTKVYTCLKTIIPVISCSWKSMETIGY